MIGRRLSAALVACVLTTALSTSVAPVASAQTPPTAMTPSERAEQLYMDAKRLVAEGRTREACPMFEDSQRLEPAIGTQFNLADCYEKTGRPAAALAFFLELSRIAQMSGKQERQRAADERSAVLDKIVPRIRVLAPPSPTGVVLTTRIDAKPVSPSDLSRGVPVDPGDHAVIVEAAGHKSWSTTVHTNPPTGATGAVVDVTPPALEKIAPTVIVAPAAPASKWRPVSIAMMGLGTIGIVTGTIFGVSAISRKDEAGCNGTDCSQSTDPASGDKLRDAQSAGTASTIFFIAGGALAAGGLVLFLTTSRAAPRAVGYASPNGVGLRLEQTF